jgi:hypothetical protein
MNTTALMFLAHLYEERVMCEHLAHLSSAGFRDLLSASRNLCRVCFLFSCSGTRGRVTGPNHHLPINGVEFVPLWSLTHRSYPMATVESNTQVCCVFVLGNMCEVLKSGLSTIVNQVLGSELHAGVSVSASCANAADMVVSISCLHTCHCRGLCLISAPKGKFGAETVQPSPSAVTKNLQNISKDQQHIFLSTSTGI